MHSLSYLVTSWLYLFESVIVLYHWVSVLIQGWKLTSATGRQGAKCLRVRSHLHFLVQIVRLSRPVQTIGIKTPMIRSINFTPFKLGTVGYLVIGTGEGFGSFQKKNLLPSPGPENIFNLPSPDNLKKMCCPPLPAINGYLVFFRTNTVDLYLHT